MLGSFSNGDHLVWACRSSISGNIRSGDALMVAERWIWNPSGLVAAYARIAIRTTAMTRTMMATMLIGFSSDLSLDTTDRRLPLLQPDPENRFWLRDRPCSIAMTNGRLAIRQRGRGFCDPSPAGPAW